MTHFEFVTVAVSMVYALSIARCLDAMPFAFDRDRRYWIHFTWLCVKLANPAVLWWSLWGLNEAGTLPFSSFLALLIIPGTLYLQVIALVTTNPSDITDWKTHYYARRMLFFGTNIFLLFMLLLAGHFLYATPSPIPIKLTQILTIILSGIAMISQNEKLHACIAILAALNMFVMAFALAVTAYVS